MTERRLGLSAPWMRAAILLGMVALLEVVGRSGMLSPTTFVPPSAMLVTLIELGAAGTLWPHLGRTMFEATTAFVLATLLGVPLGIVLWRVPYLARVFEPYLTAMYALPLVFFYPLLLALFGLGPAPIIVIATLMACIPVIVNARIGFSEVRDIYRRLGRSVGCSPLQLYRKVLIPAAAPALFAGLKLGFVYALIGAIAMEFVLADGGLGFAVRYHYNNFDTPEMYAYVLLNLGIAVGVNSLLLRGESGVQGRAA